MGRVHAFARYIELLEGGPLARHTRVRAGVRARQLLELSAMLDVKPEKLLEWIGISNETAKHLLNADEALTAEEGERAIGIEQLIGLVAKIVMESGSLEDFNAGKWTGRWLDRPNAALGGRAPGEFLGTAEEQQLVGSLIKMMQSGAYA